MPTSAANDRLERLRRFRLYPSKDVSITGAVKRFAAEARRADRTLASLREAWSVRVPGHLRECCTAVSIRAGTLVVACDSPSAAYDLTRWLQEGGRRSLSEAGPPVLRVRFVSPVPESGRTATQPNGSRQVKQNRRAGRGESKSP